MDLKKYVPENVGEISFLQFFSDATKPLCFFGVWNLPRGLDIEKEMLKWLLPNYNVIVVRHDGSKFEYPALKIMQNYVINTNYTGHVLYVHSKGAWFVRRTSEMTRNMWKHEFADRKQMYIDAVSVSEPTMATPYQGIIMVDIEGLSIDKPTQVPWFNGWMANRAAIEKMNIYPSDNRFTYEKMIYKGINIVGIREQDVDINVEESRNKMYSDLSKF